MYFDTKNNIDIPLNTFSPALFECIATDMIESKMSKDKEATKRIEDKKIKKSNQQAITTFKTNRTRT